MRRIALSGVVIPVVAFSLVIVGQRALSGPSLGVQLGLAGLEVFAAAANNATPTDVTYYYLVVDTDGVADYRELTAKEATDRKKKQQEELDDAVKDWRELKGKWTKSLGSKPFPVSPPKIPVLRQLGRTSTTDKVREATEKAQKKRLEIYDVCILTNSKGEKSADAIRHDKVSSREVQLQKDFVEAAIAWADARKDQPDAKGEGAPVAPSIKLVKGEVESSEVAGKLAEKLTEKLRKDEEKKQADANKPDANKQPEEKKDAPKNAVGP